MLLFIVVSAGVVVSLVPPEAQARAARQQSRAMVRIERPARGNRAEWEALTKLSRHEIVREENGEPIVLRLIEYE